MSTPVNYYLYLARGQSANEGNVTASTSTGGTSGDVEVRLQIDNGTTTTKLKKIDAILQLRTIIRYIESNAIQDGAAGVDLPAL
jgi:hypothetical protein